jgi:hypothetical protein
MIVAGITRKCTVRPGTAALVRAVQADLVFARWGCASQDAAVGAGNVGARHVTSLAWQPS